jgi:hypothetical protein
MGLLFVGLWLCCKAFLPSMLMTVHDWGPQVRGRVTNGTEVFFQSRVVGRETDDRIVVISPQRAEREYMVDQIHAGFGYVVLKVNDGETQLWVEADGKVGASLDLSTGEFWPEGQNQAPWARYGTGRVLAEGRTWSFHQVLIYLIVPWY